MKITEITAKSILSPQQKGFLRAGPHPFSHSLSPYVGCGYGNTYCGTFCYAPELPNWKYGHDAGEQWGGAVSVKVNAPELLAEALAKTTPIERQAMRIFLSSSTDPYQPIEAEYGITRRLLKVFAQYDDLGLLVVQTRSPLAAHDFYLMKQIPYLWLSVTVETDRQDILTQIKPGGPTIQSRLDMLWKAKRDYNINTQIVVSPCLPYSIHFVDTLMLAVPDRIVVDSFIVGDGSRGARTAASPFAKRAQEIGWNWRDEKPAIDLYQKLIRRSEADHDGLVAIGWWGSGFCGAPSRGC